MKKTIKYLIILFALIISSIVSVQPVLASDGQFIDHILLFEPIITTHSFNLTLEKNQKYEFACELYSPGVKMELILSLTGPDGDGNGFDDEFIIGAGDMESGSGSSSISSVFGCAITGNYTLDVTGNVTENTNVHLAIYDRGPSYTGKAILFDTSGYYNTKVRQYWFDLKDDTQYTIIASRTNSIPNNETMIQKLFGEVQEAFVTVILYDEEDRPFNMIRGVELENVFGMEEASASFGVSFKGEYRITVEIAGSIETVNVMMILKEGSNVGDGPEDDPVDPDTNSTTSPEQQFTVSVPKWTFGVVFAGGMVFVLIAVAISRERSMKNIIR